MAGRKPQWQRRQERLERFEVATANGNVVRQWTRDPQPRHAMPVRHGR